MTDALVIGALLTFSFADPDRETGGAPPTRNSQSYRFPLEGDWVVPPTRKS